MSVQSTDPITGKPTFNDVSTTQADLQAVADWVVTTLITPLTATTYASLPASGFPGQRARVTTDSTPANNGWYWWTGSTWARDGLYQEIVQFHDTTSAAGGPGLNAGDTIDTVVLPALPYATKATIEAAGTFGNLAGATANPWYQLTATAGTLTQTVAGASQGPSVGASGWGAQVTTGTLTIPAGTSVTLKLIQQSTANKTIAKGAITVRLVNT